jgi:hypothetical protein
MLFVAHRINTIAELRDVPPEQGVEIDLRDRGDRLILQHDPFSDGENFSDWLAHYRHALLILNIKSERIEQRVLELVHARGIESYFLLDCSFPMIRLLNLQNEPRIAVRFSECEPLEAALALAGKVDWVWIDCFTRMPLAAESYQRLKASYKLCAVSPELQGRPVESIADYADALRPYPVDAVCTKRPDLWQAALATTSSTLQDRGDFAWETRAA